MIGIPSRNLKMFGIPSRNLKLTVTKNESKILKPFMNPAMFLIQIFRTTQESINIFTNKSCILDSDCHIREHPDVHSLFCVNNVCQKLIPPGHPCMSPSDCSSYPFYGPIACTSRCHIENECTLGTKELLTQFCCKQIPENKECVNNRPTLINGCNGTAQCLLNNENEYVCTSENRNYWIFGVFLSVLGNLLINLGINLQKLSFVRDSLYLFNIPLSIFHCGIFIYILGKISGFSSYIFGKQSLLTSLGGMGLIMNSIFAPLINQEIFSIKDFCAIILVLLGSSIIIMNSVKISKINSLCELIKMYQNKATIIWFILLCILLLCIFLIIKFVEVNSDWHYPGDFEFLMTDTYFEQTDFTLKYVMVFLYIMISGIIASITTLFAKSFGLMIEMTLNGDNQFLYGVTYLFFIGIVFCTFGQIYWLNRALRHYDALLCIPLFYVNWTFFSNINAGIYFKDFEHFSKDQFKGFLCGWVIILLGVGFLASRSNYNTVDIEATHIESSQ